jgi:hypothetical protein
MGLFSRTVRSTKDPREVVLADANGAFGSHLQAVRNAQRKHQSKRAKR